MDIVLTLLCISGIAFALRSVSGPFDLFDKVRNLLMRLPLVGPVLNSVMECDFCLGLWASVGMYFLTGGSLFNVGELILWAFGGAMWNTLFHRTMDRLHVCDDHSHNDDATTTDTNNS